MARRWPAGKGVSAFTRSRAAAIGAVAALFALFPPLPLSGQLPPQQALFVSDVTVVDVDAGTLVPKQTVVVRDGRIVSVDRSRDISVPDVRRIDGRNKFLVPGLIDTHVHLALGADRDRLPALGPLLAHGVTGVRDAGAGGQDEWLVALRDRVARGEVLSPRIYVSGMVSGRSIRSSKSADAGALASRLLALGVDGLKIRDGLTDDDIRAVVDVATRAKRPVYGHTYDAASRERNEIYTLTAVERGVTGTMHIMGMPQLGTRVRPEPPPGPRFGENWQRWWVYYATFWLHADPDAERALIERMVARGVWLEPTLITEHWITANEVYRDSWQQRQLPGSFAQTQAGFPLVEGADLQRYRDAFGRMKDFVRRFHAAGGVVLAGTDCLPACGHGLWDELALLVEAGLTPASALRAATVDAARALGWGERSGRIATGNIADLVLLDANPLTDIRNVGRVHAVILNGRYLDRAALDGLLTNSDRP
jgi:imidazolonepropionase-like amidohydrolase